MTYLSSLPDDAVLLHVFRMFPATSRPLVEYHEILMRGPSSFSPGERELIAAYVSGLNGCHYCHGVHTATAEAFGVEEDLLTQLLENVDSAPVDERLKPVLSYVAKLTTSPARVTRADAEAMLDAGWDDRAIHDAVSVCALFNFMNRLVEGLGVDAGPEYFNTAATRLSERGYDGLLELLDG